ncbi:MAG: hypothetical protein HC867_06010 [Bacteroidia bacterium]|nr:hypothetical protein [Bacteroidia bacterium]
MHLKLNEYLNSKERIQAFKECIDKTKLFFLDKGSFISIDELNAFQLINETKHEWVQPLEVNNLINLLNQLEELVDKKSKSQVNK